MHPVRGISQQSPQGCAPRQESPRGVSPIDRANLPKWRNAAMARWFRGASIPFSPSPKDTPAR